MREKRMIAFARSRGLVLIFSVTIDDASVLTYTPEPILQFKCQRTFTIITQSLQQVMVSVEGSPLFAAHAHVRRTLWRNSTRRNLLHSPPRWTSNGVAASLESAAHEMQRSIEQHVHHVHTRALCVVVCCRSMTMPCVDSHSAFPVIRH
jgi:hypothetical protein